jgi:hypothetical protein
MFVAQLQIMDMVHAGGYSFFVRFLSYSFGSKRNNPLNVYSTVILFSISALADLYCPTNHTDYQNLNERNVRNGLCLKASKALSEIHCDTKYPHRS